MKLFWTIPTLAVLAAMIFGSLLHRRGQANSEAIAESNANGAASRIPSFVADSQLPAQESEMPSEFPLMPELLPEPKNELPQVKFVSDSSMAAKNTIPRVSEATVRRVTAMPAKRHLSTVDLSKNEMPQVAPLALKRKSVSTAETAETPSLESESDGRFLPIVLHIGSEEGRLVIQGSIPTRKDADAFHAAVVKVAGEDSVDNYLKYSPETLNADWVANLPEYVETFLSHSAGRQELIVFDGILKLRGDVVSQNSKNGLVTLAESLKEGGLEIDTGLVVKESLAGELPELPGSYAAALGADPEAGAEPKDDLKLAMSEAPEQLSLGEDAQSRSASILADELAIKSEKTAIEEEVETVMAAAPLVEEAAQTKPAESTPKPGFVGPAVSPAEWAAGIKKAKEELVAAQAAKVAAGKEAELVAAKAKADAEAAAEKKKVEMEVVAKLKAEQEAASIAAAAKAKEEKEAADAAAKEAKLEAMLAFGERIPDDGKPLIFYFETNSSEIISSDREKLARAIQRVQIPRSIVYITAYADYRGGYEANRKLSLERAEKVRGLIFAGEIADQVTAEIKAKGDSQSVKQDRGKRETDEALKRSRRVVVEVYHLKR